MSEQTLKYELTMDEAAVVMQALGELPFRVSAGLIQKMQMQAHLQLNPPAEKAADDKKGSE